MIEMMGNHLDLDLVAVVLMFISLWLLGNQRREGFIFGLLAALAFVAFNVPDFADFVVERPTEIQTDAGTSCRVHHYSELVSLPSANRLYAL